MDPTGDPQGPRLLTAATAVLGELEEFGFRIAESDAASGRTGAGRPLWPGC
ncbi:hypothetical protein M1L60_27355 [Actinoplanes sp. TRM 88003]|uniref:Uncharacterized protein n=1 Tax=Paractinoplanes aksuensis TaxID=2939490 RepID=A0ABT1DTZ2_9ACTN|nr:hypothetical protein [Actinoplanes aksuensis]MCO8274323.1 hypothetical protein [Actinoplanes aksuensis]